LEEQADFEKQHSGRTHSMGKGRGKGKRGTFARIQEKISDRKRKGCLHSSKTVEGEEPKKSITHRCCGRGASWERERNMPFVAMIQGTRRCGGYRDREKEKSRMGAKKGDVPQKFSSRPERGCAR